MESSDPTAKSPMTQRVFRFAPSPNGELHLGHALSALLNFEMARAVGGRFLLRIEDIDRSRSRVAFERQILDDLAWLGLEWETPVRRQSDFFDDYRAALDRLQAMGLVYPSFASRGEIAAAVDERERASGAPWPRDPDGAPLYPFCRDTIDEAEAARRLANGEPHALRLDMAAAMTHLDAPLTWSETGAGPIGETGTVEAAPGRWGDVVIARKDVPTSYHLAVVVDDAAQGVTDVVRGQDLFWSTSVHRLLQNLLGLPAPRYHHHRLIVDAAGRKLSKSDKDTSLKQLRADGATPNGIRHMIGLAAAVS